jgi:hypothetical protein
LQTLLAQTRQFLATHQTSTPQILSPTAAQAPPQQLLPTTAATIAAATTPVQPAQLALLAIARQAAARLALPTTT